MMKTNKYAAITEHMLRNCYTCDHACECTEEMIAACMNERAAEPVYPEQVETRELLRLYEQ